MSKGANNKDLLKSPFSKLATSDIKPVHASYIHYLSIYFQLLKPHARNFIRERSRIALTSGPATSCFRKSPLFYDKSLAWKYFTELCGDLVYDQVAVFTGHGEDDLTQLEFKFRITPRAAAYQAAAVLASSYVRQLNFWSPKNIAISVLAPGSSHTIWVLEIAQELASRGHNVTFLCKIENEKYARDYPGVKLHSLGKSHFIFDHEKMSNSGATKDFRTENVRIFFQVVQQGFREDYLLHADYIQEQRPDVIICDTLADACIRAADEYNIPMIAASTMAMGPDTDAPFLNSFFFGTDPTTAHESIWTRFYNNFIFTPMLFHNLKPVLEEGIQVRKKLGLKSASQPFAGKLDHSIKLVNSFYGVEVARAVGPLVRFVGPIMQTQYPGMDPTTTQFLNSHQKIVYVAFGHHATPAPEEFGKVLTALIDSMDAKIIDGFVWATVRVSAFPDTIYTANGEQLSTTGIMQNPDKFPHYKFVKWAPQFAILAHPSTAVFVTHGGANSIYEALYTGTKMLVHPFFADQPGNAQKLLAAGVALTNDRMNLQVQVISDNIRLLVEDKDNKFAESVKRMSKLVQLKALDAVTRAATTIEEVAFTSKEDELPHLITADRNMSFMKAHNYDLYLLLAAVLLSISGVLITVIYMIVKGVIISLRPKQKSKKE
ncbi:hypothetical protein INT43_000328 [Umbelopsis isabellina]|uniref:UDP-glycosyltransferases domain-containing protein n=1 Tax=Mortierella isabellina TaxID=91625 RepID=A0A8H7UMN5_MORIS|nr:hypothetical protein INT43_000328 [Umbelopsis isabellina]